MFIRVKNDIINLNNVLVIDTIIRGGEPFIRFWYRSGHARFSDYCSITIKDVETLIEAAQREQGRVRFF